jgi:6-phosphofructokinase 1
VADNERQFNFKVPTLKSINFKNPIAMPVGKDFVHDDTKLLYNPHLPDVETMWKAKHELAAFEVAGPREFLAFDPAQTKMAIVTCGGLCPGINTVVRAIVLQAFERYGIKSIVGVRFGYHGLGQKRRSFKTLTPEVVADIHDVGGTILGTSRGTPPASEIVDCLVEENIQILFTVGGDGTMHGAHGIQKEVEKRGLQISIVGVPKTIDNDIPFVRKSFGFETATEVACQALHAAHVEAQSFDRCIGLVRLMGRHSGYIAATATLASGHVNYCLIPEVDFDLEGPKGLLKVLETRLEEKHNAVIVVAEGAGQKYFDAIQGEKDPSGNQVLGNIGDLLKKRITDYFLKIGKSVTIKYIDPSYMIRSEIANPADQLLCARFAQMAVHAAMAGKTGMMIGYWHGRMTHVPLEALEGLSQRIKEHGELWFNVLETTGQPARLGMS